MCARRRGARAWGRRPCSPAPAAPCSTAPGASGCGPAPRSHPNPLPPSSKASAAPGGPPATRKQGQRENKLPPRHCMHPQRGGAGARGPAQAPAGRAVEPAGRAIRVAGHGAAPAAPGARLALVPGPAPCGVGAPGRHAPGRPVPRGFCAGERRAPRASARGRGAGRNGDPGRRSLLGRGRGPSKFFIFHRLSLFFFFSATQCTVLRARSWRAVEFVCSLAPMRPVVVSGRYHLISQAGCIDAMYSLSLSWWWPSGVTVFSSSGFCTCSTTTWAQA